VKGSYNPTPYNLMMASYLIIYCCVKEGDEDVEVRILIYRWNSAKMARGEDTKLHGKVSGQVSAEDRAWMTQWIKCCYCVWDRQPSEEMWLHWPLPERLACKRKSHINMWKLTETIRDGAREENLRSEARTLEYSNPFHITYLVSLHESHNKYRYLPQLIITDWLC
jgi:hypothetical protein